MAFSMFNKAKTKVSHLRVSPGVLFSMMKFLMAVNLIAQAKADETGLFDQEQQQPIALTGNYSGDIMGALIASIPDGWHPDQFALLALAVIIVMPGYFVYTMAQACVAPGDAAPVDAAPVDAAAPDEQVEEKMEAKVSPAEEIYALTKSEAKLLPACIQSVDRYIKSKIDQPIARSLFCKFVAECKLTSGEEEHYRGRLEKFADPIVFDLPKAFVLFNGRSYDFDSIAKLKTIQGKIVDSFSKDRVPPSNIQPGHMVYSEFVDQITIFRKERSKALSQTSPAQAPAATDQVKGRRKKHG